MYGSAMWGRRYLPRHDRKAGANPLIRRIPVAIAACDTLRGAVDASSREAEKICIKLGETCDGPVYYAETRLFYCLTWTKYASHVSSVC